MGVKPTVELYAESIKYLLDNESTIHQFAEATGFHIVTSGRILRTFHKYKLVHIANWEQDRRGRDSVRVYKWGQGKDVKRFKMTPAQRQQRRRDLLKKIKHPTSLLRPLSVGL
jgi:hypothetical protein